MCVLGVRFQSVVLRNALLDRVFFNEMTLYVVKSLYFRKEKERQRDSRSTVDPISVGQINRDSVSYERLSHRVFNDKSLLTIHTRACDETYVIRTCVCACMICVFCMCVRREKRFRSVRTVETTAVIILMNRAHVYAIIGTSYILLPTTLYVVTCVFAVPKIEIRMRKMER